MRVVIQRSLHSFVCVNSEIVGSIDKGLTLLVCMEKNDTQRIIEQAAFKILKLRIFPDLSTGRMDNTIKQAEGKILAVSQFTLSWRGQKGNRPSFDESMVPELAESLFNRFCDLLKLEAEVETGQFGTDMKVTIENDGPVTFMLDFN
ncbi:MAG: D-tyrosyl-tRNA(Tyr) deacylase [Bacteriovoracaceae bacterium]|jgi:D-aminoacyl-tRNA deacylase|nr:D-tyrosyl-tRNA(Tyr) deacylase [Bacteriovoracaceae bacterium]